MLTVAAPPSGKLDRILTSFFRSRFYKGYSKRYFELVEVDKEELKVWELPIAVHRLQNDNIPQEKNQLLNIIRTKLYE